MATVAVDKAVDVTRAVLVDVLALPPSRAAALRADTPLFGSMPELDSMAVASILTEIEDRCHVIIDDDDVSAESFATFGSLASLVRAKLAA